MRDDTLLHSNVVHIKSRTRMPIAGSELYLNEDGIYRDKFVEQLFLDFHDDSRIDEKTVINMNALARELYRPLLDDVPEFKEPSDFDSIEYMESHATSITPATGHLIMIRHTDGMWYARYSSWFDKTLYVSSVKRLRVYGLLIACDMRNFIENGQRANDAARSGKLDH